MEGKWILITILSLILVGLIFFDIYAPFDESIKTAIGVSLIIVYAFIIAGISINKSLGDIFGKNKDNNTSTTTNLSKYECQYKGECAQEGLTCLDCANLQKGKDNHYIPKNKSR